MLVERLPAGLQGMLAKLVTLLMGAVAAFMAWYGMKLCLELLGQSISELPWMPVGFTYLPVPLGGFITLLFVIEYLIYGSQARRAVVTFDHDSLEAQ
jgi:TRAP-type C4-dicarboxylate transport system permease small subunit